MNLNKSELRQFAKYMVGGSIYFWTGFGVFAICYSVIGIPWLPAKIAADGIGWTLNYLVQRYWAFGKERKKQREMHHIGRYVFIESIGLILDYLIIYGLFAIGITPYIGFFISACFFTIWSYVWYKYWVFPTQFVGARI